MHSQRISSIDVVDLSLSIEEHILLQGFTMLSIKLGEIRGIIGPNGSGKTSFLKFISGYLPANVRISGEVRINDVDVGNFYGRAVAKAHGVFLVPQDPPVVPSLSLWENVVLGDEASRFGILREVNRDKARTTAALSLFAKDVDLDKPGAALGLAERQVAAIARALIKKPSPQLILLDEPTTHLSTGERSRLFALLRGMVLKRGVGVIIVSHVPDDIVELAEVVTIVQSGRVRDTIHMQPSDSGGFERRVREAFGVGGGVTVPRSSQRGEVVGKLVLQYDTRKQVLELERGTVSALLTRSTEEADRVFSQFTGSVEPTLGVELILIGNTVKPTPKILRDEKIGIVPAKKVEFGLVPSLTVQENLLLKADDITRLWSRRARDKALDLGSVMRISEDRMMMKVAELSGGLQQRVLLARELGTAKHCVLIRSLAQGLDTRSRELFLHALRERGVAALIVTSSQEEIEEFVSTEKVFDLASQGSLDH